MRKFAVGMYKSRKKYRLMFVNDNTFNTVWSVTLTRTKVWVLSAVCCAAIAALAVAIFVWSPLKNFLPGYMLPDEREQIVDNALRIDSMLIKTEVNQRYIDNVTAILAGEEGVVNIPDAPAEVTDTLMVASDAERAFVADWQERERGNLSVLTPIVAEGMLFRLPAVGAVIADDGVTLQAARGATVVAIQDATVIDSHVDPHTGRITMLLQHANDFISTYSGMVAPFAWPGQRVTAGQALGALGADGKMTLTVWHHGTRTPLSTLLPQ